MHLRGSSNGYPNCDVSGKHLQQVKRDELVPHRYDASRGEKNSPSFMTLPTRDLLVARTGLAKAEEVILSYFNTQEFARRAFGRYWSQRTPAE